MARLVDADALIAKLRDLADKNDDNLQSYLALIATVILVNEQPTAYDVEKVVEELEKKRIEVQKMKNNCIALSDKEVCDIENITYDRAKAIVRKGGVE